MRAYTLFSKLFIIVPIILFMALAITCFNLYRKTNLYSETEGVITGFYKNTARIYTSRNSRYTISPVVSYKVDGNTYEFKGGYYSTFMKKGDKLIILYDSKNPQRAVIKKGLLFAPAIVGGLWILSVIALFIIRFVERLIT